MTKNGSGNSPPVKLQYFTGYLPIKPFDFSKPLPAAQAKSKTFDTWLKQVNPTWHWEWRHLEYVRRFLNKVTTGECKRLMIFMPPRHGKSEQCTVRYPVWRLTQDPTLRVIVAAYNQILANKFSRKSRRIAERCLDLSKDRLAVEDWETAQGGGIRAVGVGGGITGQGGNLVIIDDPVKNREQAQSEAYRENCWDWYTDDLYTRLEPGAAIILIITRWHEDDLAGRILASEDGPNWTVVSLPAEAEESDPLGRVLGEALCPERYNVAALGNLRTVLGDWAFTSLYQQRPLPAEGQLAQRGWFEVVDKAPPEMNKIRNWDMAATEKSIKSADPDYTVGTLMGKAGDTFYIVDVIRQRVNPGAVEQFIKDTAQADGHGVRVYWEEEGGSSGKIVVSHLTTKLAGYGAQAMPVTGDKVQRAMPFFDQARVGNVKLVRGDWVPAWLAEITAFPLGKHDDQVDSASGAFAALCDDGPLMYWGGR